VVSEVGAATHFHATRLGPQWGDGLIKVATVGMHVFYKFGHKHPVFQAHVIEASAKPPERRGVDVKPVLAALIPAAEAAEPPHVEFKPVDPKDAPAPQPVIAPAPVKPLALSNAQAPAA
jgi:hypothetical protein